MRFTWFGHSAFKLEFADKVVLIDPFITGAGQYKGSLADAVRGTTHILLTHGHSDHVGDTVEIAKQTGAKLVSNFEICMWLKGKGVENIDPMNTGGTTDQGGFQVSLVQAFHSSGEFENGSILQLGHPNGIIITPDEGPVVYHMGDTAIFGDMELIAELYEPEIGIVPIGDRFTMGPKHAAFACREFFDFDYVIPCHYKTFGLLEQSAEPFITAMDGLHATHVKVPEVGEPFDLD